MVGILCIGLTGHLYWAYWALDRGKEGECLDAICKEFARAGGGNINRDRGDAEPFDAWGEKKK